MEKEGARLALSMEDGVHPVGRGPSLSHGSSLRIWPHPIGFESEGHFQG